MGLSLVTVSCGIPLKAKMDILAAILATLALGSPASGYGSGAPADACASMIPAHGVAAQVSAAPYSLTLSSAKYGCGVDSVSVTLAGTGGANFRGFLCQTRAAMDNATTVGMLVDDDANIMFTTNCDQGSITHSENSPKISAKFKWTPSNDTTNVHIVCSVVQNLTTYWVKAIHEEISYAGLPSTCSSAARTALAFLASVIVFLANVI